MLTFKKNSDSDLRRIYAAYPAWLADDVKAVIKIVPPPLRVIGDWRRSDSTAIVGGETLSIPYRISAAEPKRRRVERLTDIQKAILATMFSRHSDGFVREKWLAEIPADATWQAPFVALLLSEYVVEIIESIEACERFDKNFFSEFVLENPELCQKITAQIATSWDAFHSGARKLSVIDPISAMLGYPRYSFVKQLPVLPLRQYPGYIVAQKCGIWVGRIPRRRRYLTSS
jgi:hypothetical protein